MKKLGLLFSGQGSQYINMGMDFVLSSVKNQEFIDQASKILGYDVKIVINDESKIHETRYTQPLVFLTTLLAFDAFKSLEVSFDGVAGFSLGEYSAYFATELFDALPLLKLVKERAELMHEETLKTKGKMAAIIGLDQETIKKLCNKNDKIVVPANFNSPIQTVISGEEEGVLSIIEEAKAIGAKRAMMLQVSGAFHSPLMKPAGDKFYELVHHLEVKNPKVPIYLNTTAKPLIKEKLFLEMSKQIYSPVLFTDIMQHMTEDGFTHFIEIGPGNVLSGLVRKINPDLQIINLGKTSDIETVKGWLIEHGFIK